MPVIIRRVLPMRARSVVLFAVTQRYRCRHGSACRPRVVRLCGGGRSPAQVDSLWAKNFYHSHYCPHNRLEATRQKANDTVPASP